MFKNSVKIAFLMPSFHGLITFSLGFVLYILRLFDYKEVSLTTILFFLLVIIFFSLSTLFSISKYKKIINVENVEYFKKTYKSNSYLFTIYLFFFVGWLGVYLYISEYAKVLGGFQVYFLLLFASPLTIRGLATELVPMGIQLTYFAWIASAVCLLEIKKKTLSKWYIISIIITILLNLLFVDRTRPTWILFTIFLPFFLINFNRFSLFKVFKLLSLFMVGLTVLFIGFKAITGKESAEGAFGQTVLPYELQDLYFYVTSGYAYFNELVINHDTFSYIPTSILYPFYKLLSIFNIVDIPPNQVLDFINVGPAYTNVGTMLQPYYQDGGFFYLILGLFLQSFLFDYLGYFLLNKGNTFSIYGWSNLCFTNFMGFFTPKIGSFPIWLILIVCIFFKVYFKRKNENIFS